MNEADMRSGHAISGAPAAITVRGIGFDLVDVARVARHARRPAYRRQLCTPGEIEACLGAPDPVLALAERFALKEACMKALGAGIRQGLWFRHIEVEGAEGLAPRLRLHRRAHELFTRLGADRIEAAVARRGPLVAALVLIGSAEASGSR